MSVDMNLVAANFKKKSSRAAKPSDRLKEVIWALDKYVKQPSKGTLDLLSARVENWEKKDPEEYKIHGGVKLWKAVDSLQIENSTVKEQPKPLEDGDILFRYVPRGINQRGFMQWLISLGQGEQQKESRLYPIKRNKSTVIENKIWQPVFHGITGFGSQPRTEQGIADSWDLIQHVGIYINNAEFKGVIEIDGGGLSRNQVDNRIHEYDLVVRCDQDHMAKRVSGIACRVKPVWAQRNLPKLKYPILDLVFLASCPRTGGVMSEDTFIEVGIRGLKFVGDGTQYNMDQMVVCSHFVHAVLWAAADPAVTVRAATMHKFENVFKISPCHLWRQSRVAEGVFTKLHASFKGIQQDGRLVTMVVNDLDVLAA